MRTTPSSDIVKLKVGMMLSFARCFRVNEEDSADIETRLGLVVRVFRASTENQMHGDVHFYKVRADQRSYNLPRHVDIHANTGNFLRSWLPYCQTISCTSSATNCGSRETSIHSTDALAQASSSLCLRWRVSTGMPAYGLSERSRILI